MVKYLCDLCGKEMEEEHHLLIKIHSYFGGEDNVVRIKDNCGYQDIECCKECEHKINEALNYTLNPCVREKKEVEQIVNCYGEEYNRGYQDGYKRGLNEGYNKGYDIGFQRGILE